MTMVCYVMSTKFGSEKTKNNQYAGRQWVRSTLNLLWKVHISIHDSRNDLFDAQKSVVNKTNRVYCFAERDVSSKQSIYAGVNQNSTGAEIKLLNSSVELFINLSLVGEISYN